MEWEKMKKMINELMIDGRHSAQQLHSQFNSASSSSSQETREELAKKILESYHKSLTLMASSGEAPQDSPHCLAGGSPNSEDSDQDPHPKSSKNAMPRWKQKVRITPGNGIDSTLDDGFSWRKYGQKDILRAKFPRGYYRCTHRNSQGCQATKQVQRSDNDPMLFDITYRGTHTCSQAPNIVGSSNVQTLEPNHASQELENPQGNLRIVTQGLDVDNHSQQQQQQQQHYNQHFPSSSNANIGDNNAYDFYHVTNDVGLYGTTGYSDDIGNYGFSISGGGLHGFNQEITTPHHHDAISPSPSTSNSPHGNAAFDPSSPYGRFGGFFS